jgi:hypothetical protein
MVQRKDEIQIFASHRQKSIMAGGRLLLAMIERCVRDAGGTYNQSAEKMHKIAAFPLFAGLTKFAPGSTKPSLGTPDRDRRVTLREPFSPFPGLESRSTYPNRPRSSEHLSRVTVAIVLMFPHPARV